MIVGIDLGTTKSVVGIWKDGKPHIICGEDGGPSIPSLVLRTPQGEILAGRNAQEHPECNLSKNITISSVNRRMGKKDQTDLMLPQEVSARVLIELKDRAEKSLGQEVKEAVIAIPSHFDARRRKVAREAAEIAGIEVKRLLNEATAAVLRYGLHDHSEKKVLAFDFGGGNLDVSIVRVEADAVAGERMFKVICTEGNGALGGDDLTQIIYDYCLKKSRKIFESRRLKLDPAKEAVLRENAERAKVSLSSQPDARVLIRGFLGSRDLDVFISRKTFEKQSKRIFKNAISLLEQALNSAHMQPSDLNAILLLGGTSRVPYIRDRIAEKFKPIKIVDSTTYVAEGAIIQAAILEGNLKNHLLVDALPNSYSYVIGNAHDNISQIIEKNAEYPTKRTITIKTTEHKQSTISIKIYQGEKTSKDAFLAKVDFDGIPSASAGRTIDVTFHIDVDMDIDVSAKDSATGRGLEKTVRLHGLDRTQITEMRKKLSVEFHRKHLLEYKCSIERILSENAPALDCSDIAHLKKTAEGLSDCFEKTISEEELKTIVDIVRPPLKTVEEKIDKYKKVVTDIRTLVEKIRKRAPSLEQTADLLENSVNHKRPYRELEERLLSACSHYEEAITRIIRLELSSLETSGEMGKWVDSLRDASMEPSLVSQQISKLKEIKEVTFITNLLNSEDPKDRKSIQQRILDQLEQYPYARAVFILIASLFIDSGIVSAIEPVSHNEEADTILMLTLFLELNTEKDVGAREQDEVVKKQLLNYLISAAESKNSNVRAKALELINKANLKDYRLIKLITKSLRDPSPRIRMHALVFIERTEGTPWISDISAMLQLEKNEMVKEKAVHTLGHLKDKRVIPHLSKLLLDGNSNVRMLALSLLKGKQDLMETDFKKLVALITRITGKSYRLGFCDKVFLRWFAGRHPDMVEFIRELRRRDREHTSK